MPSTPVPAHLLSLAMRQPKDLGPAVPGVTISRETYIPGLGLVRHSFEGRRQSRRRFPHYWAFKDAELLEACEEGEDRNLTFPQGTGSWQTRD